MPYYDDGPFTLDQWNDLLTDINDLCTDPDSGCEPLEPIELVTDPHVWSVDDITVARDKLVDICGENTFDTELDLWSEGMIDELETAIERGWCGCSNPRYDIKIYYSTGWWVTVDGSPSFVTTSGFFYFTIAADHPLAGTFTYLQLNPNMTGIVGWPPSMSHPGEVLGSYVVAEVSYIS